jgi:hypothetical protein
MCGETFETRILNGMNPRELQGLLDDLCIAILQTDEFEQIDRGRAFGYFLLSSAYPMQTGSTIDQWAKQWKHCVRPENISLLENVAKILPKYPLPIFTTLNSLRKSILPHQSSTAVPSSQPKIVRPVSILAEEQIVPDILALLRGAHSFQLRIQDTTLITDNPISPPHCFVLKQLLKYVFCLKSIRESRSAFVGLIGEACRAVIDEEYAQFTEIVSNIDVSTATLVSILASLSGSAGERLIASAIICESILRSPLPSFINALLKAQEYGLTVIFSTASRMFDIGIDVLLQMIRDWTVYGYLDDKYSEFFITKASGEIPDEHWWERRYVLVEDLIPSFEMDRSVVLKILASGRAHNFTRKFRAACISYTANFGYDAPFAITVDQQKEERVHPALLWRGRAFELSLVNPYASESMKSVMHMMKDLIWIPGHLSVVQDFLLFGRGDFAAALYHAFSETTDGDAETLLLQAVKGVTNSRSYTNTITKECLTDRIDMQKKWSIQPSAAEALLVYLVNSPIDAFLGRDALSKYDWVGHLVWRLKCSECQLCTDWQSARRIANLRKIGFDTRKLCCLRHLMVCFVRTVVEYLSTDIIVCSGIVMQAKMAECVDFDEMRSIHSTRLDQLMRGAFQTPEFSVILRLLLVGLNVIGEFTDIEQEIEEIYHSILRQSRKSRDRKAQLAFVEQSKGQLTEIMTRVHEVHARFSGNLGEFYATCFDDSRSAELQWLETRLYWCVQNLR